jgi:hypothetical protein
MVAVYVGFCRELFVITPFGFLIDHKKFTPFVLLSIFFEPTPPE